ncbi:AraC family transcriptional regulator [Paenibacillus sp. YYML68]|uniref:helix-turn-helix transcriptional regulator n=1 Tax=Paenibacillus sp. YYML68 TaxID=2909250 RepID=UPI00248F9407|nr:helix-turn-helix domain-containing protein [Paenibacillus sp. YYML68]
MQPATPQLYPVVHWAQQHKQMRERIIHRRIRDFEILLLEQGTVEVQIEARAPFQVQPGQFFILPSRLKHRVQVTCDTYALFLGVHFDFYNELHIAKDEDIIVYEDKADDDSFCSLPDQSEFSDWLQAASVHASPDVYSLLERIIHEFTHRPAGYMMCCQGLLLQLFVQITRAIHQHHREQASAGTQQAISDLARTIEASPGDDWSNERLAAILSVNVDYMGRLFKKCIGASPNKFVQHIRHSKAKRLLRDTNDTIEHIGRTIGYTDVHYFARIFHKWEGMPPGEYRKLCRLL